MSKSQKPPGQTENHLPICHAHEKSGKIAFTQNERSATQVSSARSICSQVSPIYGGRTCDARHMRVGCEIQLPMDLAEKSSAMKRVNEMKRQICVIRKKCARARREVVGIFSFGRSIHPTFTFDSIGPPPNIPEHAKTKSVTR